MTLENIITPRIVSIDSGKMMIVDEASFQKKAAEGATYSNLAEPKKAKLENTRDLEQAYRQYRQNILND